MPYSTQQTHNIAGLCPRQCLTALVGVVRRCSSDLPGSALPIKASLQLIFLPRASSLFTLPHSAPLLPPRPSPLVFRLPPLLHFAFPHLPSSPILCSASHKVVTLHISSSTHLPCTILFVRLFLVYALPPYSISSSFPCFHRPSSSSFSYPFLLCCFHCSFLRRPPRVHLSFHHRPHLVTLFSSLSWVLFFAFPPPT